MGYLQKLEWGIREWNESNPWKEGEGAENVGNTGGYAVSYVGMQKMGSRNAGNNDGNARNESGNARTRGWECNE